MNSPIAVFLYNRPNKSHICLKSLSLNHGFNGSPLYIFIDGPKSKSDKIQIQKIKKVVNDFEFKNLKQVFISQNNMGLANSVFKGVNKILNLYDTVIVVEDDLVLSPFFLNFINNCLKKYQNKNIYQVSGYVWGEELKNQLSPFLIPNINSWGWGTWKSKWEGFKLGQIKKQELINFNSKYIKKFNLSNSYNYYKILKKHLRGKVDSWAIQWYYFVFKKNGYTIYPHSTLVLNKGMDGSGTHTISNKFKQQLELDFKINYPDTLSFDEKIYKKFCEDFKKSNKENLFNKILIRFLRHLKK